MEGIVVAASRSQWGGTSGAKALGKGALGALDLEKKVLSPLHFGLGIPLKTYAKQSFRCWVRESLDLGGTYLEVFGG
jgi:hypothetical protein